MGWRPKFRNGITFRAFVRKSMDPLDLTGNCKQNIVIEPRTTEMTWGIGEICAGWHLRMWRGSKRWKAFAGSFAALFGNHALCAAILWIYVTNFDCAWHTSVQILWMLNIQVKLIYHIYIYVTLPNESILLNIIKISLWLIHFDIFST